MLRRLSALCRYLIFFVIIVLALARINAALEEKGLEYQYYSPYVTHDGFYATPQDTLDVVFVGSSHVFYSFIPQELYDQYGITSFNLGTPAQSVVTSYYWLEEMFKTQHPKVVVYEAFTIPWVPMSYYEPHARTAMSGMRWSLTRLNMATALADWYGEDPLEYVLSNIKFHSRWDSLTQGDFTGYSCPRELRGYLPVNWWCNEEYEPFAADAEGDPVSIPETSLDYLDRIQSLCAMNGAKLVLTTVPSKEWFPPQYKAVAAYASEHGLDYYDLNLPDAYEEIGYDYSRDSHDFGGHANISGATKLTTWLGKLLTEQYGLQGHEAQEFEDTHDLWQDIKDEMDLRNTFNWKDWVDSIDTEKYACFVLKGPNTAEEVQNALTERLQKMGVKTDGEAFVSVVGTDSDGTALKRTKEKKTKKVKMFGSLGEGTTFYTIGISGDEPSLLLTYQEGVEQERIPDDADEGISIIVYDPKHQVIVDGGVIRLDEEEHIVLRR